MFSTLRFKMTILGLITGVVVPDLRAQPGEGVIRSVGANSQYGLAVAHTKGVNNVSGAKQFMIGFEYDSQLTDSLTWEKYGNKPHQGLIFNFGDYGKTFLGSSVTLAYYLQPTYRLSTSIEGGLRATTGISWNSNPFDSLENPVNQSYSTAINGYLAIGLHLNFTLSKRVRFGLMVQSNHISNGGLSKPNKGLNWITAGMGFLYNIEPPVLAEYKIHKRGKDQKSLRYDCALYYSRPMLSQASRQQYNVTGMQVQVSWCGRLQGWTLASELTRDNSYTALAELNQRQNVNPNLSGLLLGHEFVFRKFNFSQQLGTYLYADGNLYPLIYHRWGLTYFPLRNFGLGVNLKVHKETANFLDFRLVYSVNR